MVRTPYCDKSGLRKGTWTPEEDWKLIAYVTTHGHKNWRQLPKLAGNTTASVNYDISSSFHVKFSHQKLMLVAFETFRSYKLN